MLKTEPSSICWWNAVFLWHLSRLVLKEESHSWICVFCTRSVQDAVSWCVFQTLFFFCFFVIWALRTQCVNYEEPPLCPHALRQNRCVCLCVCVCLAVCCCCVCGGRSLRNPELLVPPGFFFLFFFFHFFFRGVPLTFPSLVVCVCVGQTLACVRCVNVYVCKKKKNRHLSFGGASVDPPPVRYI